MTKRREPQAPDRALELAREIRDRAVGPASPTTLIAEGKPSLRRAPGTEMAQRSMGFTQ